MDFLRHRWKILLILILVLANLIVWVEVYRRQETNILTVYFFDVGQGDSIFIETPSHKRVLIDGGPNRGVLSELGKVLPFMDRRIDLVIETHPDKDHIGGLPEVVKRFNVGMFLEPGVESENSIDNELHAILKQKNVKSVLARRNMTIDFSDGAKLLILFPNQDVSKWETNDASVVAKLIYGDKSFLFTGDAPIKVENILMSLDKEVLNSDVLKVGHHGSRTSTSPLFTEIVSPDYSIISAGKDNSYGHPHSETLETLTKYSSQILSTINLGTIKFQTDGETMEIK